MLVLDTHAWLWWVADRARLSETARAELERDESVGVAAISCWEVAMLASKRRISLDREPARWVRQALAQPGMVALPLTPEIAVEAARLKGEGFGGDPADGFIYCTARDSGARLVTRDTAIRDFDPRLTLW